MLSTGKNKICGIRLTFLIRQWLVIRLLLSMTYISLYKVSSVPGFSWRRILSLHLNFNAREKKKTDGTHLHPMDILTEITGLFEVM